MGGKRQKKKREVKGAYWMDTYGDMVTLLLTFFVMLFASSQINESKWIRIVASFTGEPVGAVVEPIDPLNPTSGFVAADFIPKVVIRETAQENMNTGNMDEQQDFDKTAEEEFNELYDLILEYIDQNGLGSAIVVEKDGQYIYITILEGILFDSGYADIRDENAETILTDLGNMIVSAWDSVNMMRIEGHTDSDPIRNASFKDNRSLSSERANEVWRFMNVNCGLPNAPNIDCVGMGETEPVATNDTQEGKQQNRRVEFILRSVNALTTDSDLGIG